MIIKRFDIYYSGNDIYCTSEAGIDIRKGADPLVQVRLFIIQIDSQNRIYFSTFIYVNNLFLLYFFVGNDSLNLSA